MVLVLDTNVVRYFILITTLQISRHTEPKTRKISVYRSGLSGSGNSPVNRGFQHIWEIYENSIQCCLVKTRRGYLPYGSQGSLINLGRTGRIPGNRHQNVHALSIHFSAIMHLQYITPINKYRIPATFASATAAAATVSSRSSNSLSRESVKTTARLISWFVVSAEEKDGGTSLSQSIRPSARRNPLSACRPQHLRTCPPDYQPRLNPPRLHQSRHYRPLFIGQAFSGHALPKSPQARPSPPSQATPSPAVPFRPRLPMYSHVFTSHVFTGLTITGHAFSSRTSLATPSQATPSAATPSLATPSRTHLLRPRLLRIHLLNV